MKKNILLILIAIFLNSILSAQECEYNEYYILVNSAQKDYSNKEYKKVRKNLKSAFSKVEFPLGQDLNLALLVAKKTKDSEWAEQISIQLAKGGVPLRYFTKVKDFKWYEKFKANFENYAKFYNENFDSELRDRLIILIKEDKDFNSKYHDWRTRKIEMTLQELIDGALEILYDFNLLTNKYGIPNERKMGYNYIRRKNKVEYYTFEALMMHIYQRGEQVFINELHDIVCQGILHPNYEETLKGMTGFGNGTGVEQEMKARYEKYRRTE